MSREKMKIDPSVVPLAISWAIWIALLILLPKYTTYIIIIGVIVMTAIYAYLST